MSTRAQIVLKDSFGEELWFYRHSDGYPATVTPSLTKFLGWVKQGLIRDNVGQAGGWLIILGHTEYEKAKEPDPNDGGYGWKVGAYEPCAPQLHSDVEFLYTVDLVKKKITCKEL